MYESEQVLVDEFVLNLGASRSPWGSVRCSREFDYSRGRTDIVAVTSDGQLIAFEAKLTKWRDALHQAHRNLCFANSSFVVLPKKTAVVASRYEAEFRRRNVGLCYLDDDRIVLVFASTGRMPLQPWLAGLATAAALA